MNRNGLLTIIGVGIAVVFSLFWAEQTMQAQTAREFAAYVYQITGRWRTGPQYATDLKLGQGLRNDELVRLETERPDASIRIGLRDGSVLIQDCNTDPSTCRKPFKVVLPSLDSTYLARLQRVWNYLRNPRELQLALTMARGSEDGPAPETSVLAVRSGKPDFAPALMQYHAGNFDGVLTPDQVGAKGTTIQIVWSPPVATINGPKLPKGLYRLQILPGEGTAWVLLAEEKDAPGFREVLTQAKEMAEKWPPEMGKEARQVFLATVLETVRNGR